MTANVFGLSYAALSCSKETTLDEFNNAILCRDIGTSEHESLPAPVASSAGGADRVSQLLPGLDMDPSLVSTFLCFSKRVYWGRGSCARRLQSVIFLQLTSATLLYIPLFRIFLTTKLLMQFFFQLQIPSSNEDLRLRIWGIVMRIRSQHPVVGRPYLTFLTQQSEFLSSRSGKIPGDKSRSRLPFNYLDDRKVVNVIIAKNFDETSEEIQIQALEVRQSSSSRSGG